MYGKIFESESYLERFERIRTSQSARIRDVILISYELRESEKVVDIESFFGIL